MGARRQAREAAEAWRDRVIATVTKLQASDGLMMAKIIDLERRVRDLQSPCVLVGLADRRGAQHERSTARRAGRRSR